MDMKQHAYPVAFILLLLLICFLLFLGKVKPRLEPEKSSPKGHVEVIKKKDMFVAYGRVSRVEDNDPNVYNPVLTVVLEDGPPGWPSCVTASTFGHIIEEGQRVRIQLFESDNPPNKKYVAFPN